METTQSTFETKINGLIEIFRPEARELVRLALSDSTTKNGYGRILAFLSMLPSKPIQKIFMIALVREGYPSDTASEIGTLAGI